MSDLLSKYKTGSSPSSSLVSKYKSSSTSKKPTKKGKSPFGFVQNVAGDVRDITYGVVPAIVGTGSAIAHDVKDTLEAATGAASRPRTGTPRDNPKASLSRTKKIGKALTQGYVDTYGPLFKGDIDKFLDNLYNDPVYIGLDVLTITSGATKLAVKVVPSAAKGGRTITLVTANGEKIGKPLARGELRAQLQAATAKLANKEIPVIKRPAGVAAAKLERARLMRKDVNTRAGNQAFDVALRKNRGRPAKVASALLARFDRQALDEYTGVLRDAAAKDPKGPAAATLKIVTNPRVQRLFDNPNEKIGAVLKTARDVGEQQKALLKVADETADARRFLPARIAGGARFKPDVSDFATLPSGEIVQFVRKGNGDLSLTKTGKVRFRVVERAGGGRFRASGSGGAAAMDDFTPLASADDLPFKIREKLPETLEGGPSIEDLKARGLDPVYLPDTSARAKGHGYGGRGGGVALPAKVGNQRQNLGILQLSGQLVLDPAVLNDSFLRAAKYAHYNDIHAKLLDVATPIDYPRPGMTLIRKKRSDRVAPKDRMRSDFDEWAESNLDDLGEMQPRSRGGRSNDLITDTVDDAVRLEDGKYLAVPDKIAKTLAGEFTRQSELVYKINRYPMRVWRALVLGLRPAYLVNNAIGNTLMYLVHSARPEDLRQLAGAFKQFAKKSEGKAIDDLLNKHFAGQVRGGFVATQMPDFSPRLKINKAMSAVVNAIPALDRRWEQALRRAKVKAELKRHPELKQHAERMGSENAYFERISSSKVLEKNPDVVEQVYNRVNDALGNYDSMTAFERGTMRTLLPFWAWYRAILGVSGKLAIEQPLKVNLLSRLGEIAVEANLEEAGFDKNDVPSSLLGFIPNRTDPDGRRRGFNTAPINPFGTTGQIVEFLEALVPGGKRPGPYIPGPNPLLVDLIGYLGGKDLSGYTTPNTPGMGTVEKLPQVRLVEAARGTAPSGDTFNDRDVVDELLRYLGVPYARVSPTAAKRVVNR